MMQEQIRQRFHEAWDTLVEKAGSEELVKEGLQEMAFGFKLQGWEHWSTFYMLAIEEGKYDA